MTNKIAPELREEDTNTLKPELSQCNVSPAKEAQDFDLCYVSNHDFYMALCKCVNNLKNESDRAVGSLLSARSHSLIKVSYLSFWIDSKLVFMDSL